MRHHGANWIANEHVSACDGAVFELELPALAGAPPGRRADAIESWPRSNASDLALALAASRAAEAGWTRQGIAGRREVLDAFVRTLAEDGPGHAALGRALGLGADEPAVEPGGLARELERAVHAPGPHAWRGLVASREGPAVVAFTLHESALRLARELVRAWLAGRTAIVLSDGRVPHLSDLVARAGRVLPAGVLSVLHDDGGTCLRAALEEPAAATIHARGPVDELAEWRARLDGLAPALRARVELVPATNATRALDGRADLMESVHAAIDAALSRTGALSGLAAGHVARLVVPAPSFSRATEIAIARLEEGRADLRPLELARTNARAALERALRLAHDDGATVIPLHARDASVPLCVTNVEGGMRIARVLRPAPILSFLRAEDATLARRLAARLDAADPWEDPS